jgi:3-hydroxyacyl-[acyl-carrier protein] dehydratase / trans-2-decenoyl-[acyl-carrier protein] isomerase
LPNPHDFHTPQSSYSKDDLLRSSEGGYFGPGNAQLPAPPMLLFDRITEINADGGKHGLGYIEAEFDIDPSLWFFDCHFLGDPVMPGSLGVDALWQLVGFYLGWIGGKGRGRAVGCNMVKFSGEVTTDIKLVTYKVDMKRVINNRRLVVGIGDGRMEADGKAIYHTEDLRVGLKGVS